MTASQVPAGSGPERFGAPTKVIAGRIMAGAAILLAGYGIVALIAIGRVDHLPNGAILFGLYAVGFGSLAWLAIPRQPDNRAVWVPGWAALFAGLATSGWALAVLTGNSAGLDMSPAGFDRLSPAQFPVAGAIGWELVSLGAVASPFLMVTLWLLLFPDGELPSRRWRWVAWAAVTAMAAVTAVVLWAAWPTSTIAYGTPTEDYPGIGSLTDPIYGLLLAISGICVISLVRRYRRSMGAVRQQYLWVVLGTGALYVAVFVIDPGWGVLAATLAVTISVACYGVAVTRYRLYDIDIVISRTVVYATLAAFIGVVYVLVVVVVGGIVGSGAGNLGLAIAATALVAVAFEPVRHLAQRWANRLVYGKLATPYEVLSSLTQRLADAEPAQGMLTRMARLMAEGTGAEQATVWLADRRGQLEAAAGWPQRPEPDRAEAIDQLSGFFSPVSHDGQLVGVLEVTKARGNPVAATERRLINDLAGSAGLVLGNQRLNAALAARAAELQESRRRLVEMQDLERRRLERDLHDGAQQEVVALKLKIGLAEHVARKEGADQLAGALGGLAAEAQEAVDEIRRLARGIYPPLLESEDLATAIRSQALAMPIPVDITSDGFGRYPKDVESALYFAALEATTNAVRHGPAALVRIALRASDEMLILEVKDDGAGFDPNAAHEGTGLLNIRDRVEALGGELGVTSIPGDGTIVSVRIPLDDRTLDRDLPQPVAVSGSS